MGLSGGPRRRVVKIGYGERDANTEQSTYGRSTAVAAAGISPYRSKNLLSLELEGTCVAYDESTALRACPGSVDRTSPRRRIGVSNLSHRAGDQIVLWILYIAVKNT